MATIKNCPRCGKLFTMYRAPVCQKCEKEEEESFVKVKEYISENPHSKIVDIVNDTGVSAKRIQKFMREGRLEVSKGLEGILKCEACGLPIAVGKLCSSCTVSLSNKIDETFGKKFVSKEKLTSTGAKMHIKRNSDDD